MATTEHTINDALARLLEETRRAWRASDVVRSENTGMLQNSQGRPDILVSEPNTSPVIIETEVLPAVSVEAEAKARLGRRLSSTGSEILSTIAVRLPKELRNKQGNSLRKALSEADDLEMALYTGSDSSDCSRWPHTGWISGGIADLSTLAQSAAVPPNVVNAAVEELVTGVSQAAVLLEHVANNHPGSVQKISEELYQEDSDQTRRMAATILANAFIFQDTLAGGPGELSEVNSLEELRDAGRLGKSGVLDEWRKILAVNYWPIFDIARRILVAIPSSESKQLIDGLAKTAEKLLENRLMRSHDLTGAVFQRLIVDRKFLAAYYTTPASAALLIGLAITPQSMAGGGEWAKADDVKALRIADFACGTGTLLSTAYQRVGQLHELAGGDAQSLHPEMMATAIIGCDVLPAAAHLTASMISGAHPTVKYEQSSILTVAYGKQDDGAIALGSLDLLNPQGAFTSLSITAKAAEGMGEAEKETWLALPHEDFDVVIMNPPFTRATGHEGKKIGVPNPMFAAFSSSEEEQQLMGKTTNRLMKGTSASGQAGEASMFLVLADHKLKSNGELALVMPLSLMSGHAWEDSRVLLSTNYSDLVLVSIAGSGEAGADLSFSADTDMGECLVVARKSKPDKEARATFVILNERPAFPMLGASAARQIRHLIEEDNLRKLEDGPVGGTPIRFGDDVIGQALNASVPTSGSWNLSRVADVSLAQTAYQLAHEKRLWLPAMDRSEVASLPVSTVAGIGGEIGPYHADINGRTKSGGIRGPFDVSKVQGSGVPTYPVLWSNDAKTQDSMSFEADSEGATRQGTTTEEQKLIDKKVKTVWDSASHCHFNRDFRFNSQVTGMQFTTRKTIGGRAWLSISLGSVEQEKALVLWANTSLGLLLHWWQANKQQSGRGSIGKTALQTLPVLDVTALSPHQLDEAVKLFDDIKLQKLEPFHKIAQDSVRRDLDTRFVRDVLGLPESVFESCGSLELLRSKLGHEPSIRGHKRA